MLKFKLGVINQKGERNMSKKLRTETVDHLFDAILSLQNREECYTFFEDVCTVNELLSLSQRFEVARMLRDQKTYLDIAEKTGASTAIMATTAMIWCLQESRIRNLNRMMAGKRYLQEYSCPDR